MTGTAQDDNAANVSANLTALDDARVRVRIDAAERDSDSVGSVLAAYRVRYGLTEQDLASRLGIGLLSLAGLAEELRPGTEGQDMGLEQIADLYQADGGRLLEAFEQAEHE